MLPTSVQTNFNSNENTQSGEQEPSQATATGNWHRYQIGTKDARH